MDKKKDDLLTKDDFRIATLGKPLFYSPVHEQTFVSDSECVTYYTDAAVIAEYLAKGQPVPSFERAGAREKIFHDPTQSRAAVLTAGGLCPGLNEVIKFLTLCLQKSYGLHEIYGIRYGYRGLNLSNRLAPILLTQDMVDDIHEKGGSILGSSRGAEDPVVMVDALERMQINLLFCIGGDGTARCAHAICAEVAKRHLPISVISIPKTIDNDISYIDKSFGFETAVRMAGSFITGAHNEAKGAYNGVGLVKVMGRDSGFIAAHATLANPYVNYCLIPEEPFTLEGNDSRALLPHLVERLKHKHHAVLMVAEGAGQELFESADRERDASGNVLHRDIGILLRDEIKRYCAAHDVPVTVKYFDLGYTIRSVRAEGDDAVFCALLAQSAAHAAMAGRTDMVVGHWSGEFTHVPIALATRQRKKIDLHTPMWSCVKSLTCF